MDGAERIAAERKRQIEVEGWTPEHDAEHIQGEMALAAALFATPVLLYEKQEVANEIAFSDAWPWDKRWDKRPVKDSGNVLMANLTLSYPQRIRQLEIAGALIAAEIDRLLRM